MNEGVIHPNEMGKTQCHLGTYRLNLKDIQNAIIWVLFNQTEEDKKLQEWKENGNGLTFYDIVYHSTDEGNSFGTEVRLHYKGTEDTLVAELNHAKITEFIAIWLKVGYIDEYSEKVLEYFGPEIGNSWTYDYYLILSEPDEPLVNPYKDGDIIEHVHFMTYARKKQ